MRANCPATGAISERERICARAPLPWDPIPNDLDMSYPFCAQDLVRSRKPPKSDFQTLTKLLFAIEYRVRCPAGAAHHEFVHSKNSPLQLLCGVREREEFAPNCLQEALFLPLSLSVASWSGPMRKNMYKHMRSAFEANKHVSDVCVHVPSVLHKSGAVCVEACCGGISVLSALAPVPPIFLVAKDLRWQLRWHLRCFCLAAASRIACDCRWELVASKHGWPRCASGIWRLKGR